MIDKDVFKTWAGILGDRFNKVLASPTLRVMYFSLSESLTTDEFIVGCKRAFDECTFWPTPKEIIEFAKPVAVVRVSGAEVFRDILTWNGSENMMSVARQRLDEAGMQAFLGIGGAARFKKMKVDDEMWARKEFIELYEAAVKNIDSMSKTERARLGAHKYPVLVGETPGPKINKGPESAAQLLPGLTQAIEELK